MDVNEDLSKDALVSRREEKEEENSEGEGDEDAALRCENFRWENDFSAFLHLF